MAVDFQITSVSVSEGDGSVTFTLDIIGPVDPTSTTTVYLDASDDGTAGNTLEYDDLLTWYIIVMGDDYENLTSIITSSVGGTTVSGSVDIIDDNMVEVAQGFSLHIHNCTNTAVGCSFSFPYFTITITDNDGMYYILYISYVHEHRGSKNI